MVLLKVTCVKSRENQVVEIQGTRIPSQMGKLLIFKVGSFKPPLIIKGLKGKKKIPSYQGKKKK